MTNLKALANGKKLIDADNNILHLEQVTLFTSITSDTGCEYSMNQLDQLEIYTDPLQIEIDRLNLIITTMIDEAAKKAIPVPKGKHNHLSKAEVSEIETIFIKDPGIDRTLIVNTYNSSQPVISRIASGVHVKTSEHYKTFIMKRNLDGAITN